MKYIEKQWALVLLFQKNLIFDKTKDTVYYDALLLFDKGLFTNLVNINFYVTD